MFEAELASVACVLGGSSPNLQVTIINTQLYWQPHYHLLDNTYLTYKPTLLSD